MFLFYTFKKEKRKEGTASDGQLFSGHLPYANTNKILRISEKQRIKLDIFLDFPEKQHFLDFKTTVIFFHFILHIWRSGIL